MGPGRVDIPEIPGLLTLCLLPGSAGLWISCGLSADWASDRETAGPRCVTVTSGVSTLKRARDGSAEILVP